jgi:hypothetical protein
MEEFITSHWLVRVRKARMRVTSLLALRWPVRTEATAGQRIAQGHVIQDGIDRHDQVHLTSHADMVNNDDGLGSRGGGFFNAVFIDGECIRAVT